MMLKHARLALLNLPVLGSKCSFTLMATACCVVPVAQFRRLFASMPEEEAEVQLAVLLPGSAGLVQAYTREHTGA